MATTGSGSGWSQTRTRKVRGPFGSQKNIAWGPSRTVFQPVGIGTMKPLWSYHQLRLAGRGRAWGGAGLGAGRPPAIPVPALAPEPPDAGPVAADVGVPGVRCAALAASATPPRVRRTTAATAATAHRDGRIRTAASSGGSAAGDAVTFGGTVTVGGGDTLGRGVTHNGGRTIWRARAGALRAPAPS